MRRTETAPKGWNRSRINSASTVFEPAFPFVIVTFRPPVGIRPLRVPPSLNATGAHLQFKPGGPTPALGQKQTLAPQESHVRFTPQQRTGVYAYPTPPSDLDGNGSLPLSTFDGAGVAFAHRSFHCSTARLHRRRGPTSHGLS